MEGVDAAATLTRRYAAALSRHRERADSALFDSLSFWRPLHNYVAPSRFPLSRE